ncbi:unnamed protein product [Allacma fusca]|uniref:Uncharacterized protein n=1 Tax=Allacma fusca TaxID=39272 RepID=A0A8J2LL31_9HEXA|nr:unnamed protein product [Allacma fusca]
MRFLNQFIKVVYFMEHEKMIQVGKRTKFEKWMKFLFLVAFIHIPIAISFHISRPFATFYIVTRLFNENNSYNVLIHGISVIFESWMYLSQSFKTTFFLCCSYTYVLLTSLWTNNIK